MVVGVLAVVPASEVVVVVVHKQGQGRTDRDGLTQGHRGPKDVTVRFGGIGSEQFECEMNMGVNLILNSLDDCHRL